VRVCVRESERASVLCLTLNHESRFVSSLTWLRQLLCYNFSGRPLTDWLGCKAGTCLGATMGI
jgi:hypothetical protein